MALMGAQSSKKQLKKQDSREIEPLLSDGGRGIRQYKSFMSNDSVEDVSFSDLLKGLPNRLARQGSVIIAETGERTRQSRLPDIADIDYLESQPLVERQQRRSIIWGRFILICTFIKSFIIKNKFVIKCSLAYLLASLAVYNGQIAGLLGKNDNKHVVATVAVYFHPSRTFGSMHQSLIFVIISILFSFSVSLIATTFSSYVHKQGYTQICSFINLLFASIALGFVSYMKQKMNHPTFNTACSLAAISIISAIVKEGAQNPGGVPLDRLFNLFKIVCLGSTISVLVCYLIIPTSATKKLKKDLNDSCSLMSLYLSKIETSFITGADVNSNDVITLSSKIKKNTTNLNSSLEESKFELYLAGREEVYQIFNELVRSAQILESQLGGLKGSAEMQWSTLHQETNDTSTNASTATSIRTFSSGSESDFNNDNNGNSAMSGSTTTLDEVTAINPTQLFDLFIYYLGPSLRSFSYTIRGVLDGMPFEETESYPTKETYHYKNSLTLARDLFTKKHERAITKLYEQKIFKANTTIETKIDEEEVAASCGNFASILTQYSKELDNFIELLSDYGDSLENNSRSWNWLKFWQKNSYKSDYKTPGLDVALENLNMSLLNRTERSSGSNTHLLSYKIWKFFSFFRRVEVQFGIRVGLGAFVLASLAYLPQTKQTFLEWRGEWSLVTYCIIMNKSLGGTTMTVNWRILGTFLGAGIAFTTWSISDGNVYALCFTGWFISLFCFNIILNWNANNAYGRFILLTYNITALYSFNVTRQEDLEEGDSDSPIIQDIAIHRFIGIIGGVMWALIMTVSFFPITARHRLKRGLSLLWLRLGVIWNSDPLKEENNLLIGLPDQRGINIVMRELELLLKQAPKETRLKGKFRLDIYKKMMKSTERIIDSFANMNTMIKVEPEISENEYIVLNYTRQEREELQNRIFLIFYMVSSSITLGFPIPAKPASTEHAKDRIMVKLGEIRHQKLLSNEDYVLLYSYVLVSNVITRELNKIINLLGDLYGLVDQETFEI